MKNYITTICALVGLLGFGNCYADIKDNFISDFKNQTLSNCDATFHKIDNQPGVCEDTYCRDFLVGAWAECWKRSMQSELDKRFLRLSNSNSQALQFEKNLQKKFDSAVKAACGKDCYEDSGTMHGIPYNFCRVDAYKYRLAQIIQINTNSFAIPTKNLFAIHKTRADKHKVKDTYFYSAFIEDICHMPNAVWQAGAPPQGCRNKAFKELSSFEFTDDVCDLS